MSPQFDFTKKCKLVKEYELNEEDGWVTKEDCRDCMALFNFDKEKCPDIWNLRDEVDKEMLGLDDNDYEEEEGDDYEITA